MKLTKHKNIMIPKHTIANFNDCDPKFILFNLHPTMSQIECTAPKKANNHPEILCIVIRSWKLVPNIVNKLILLFGNGNNNATNKNGIGLLATDPICMKILPVWFLRPTNQVGIL